MKQIILTLAVLGLVACAGGKYVVKDPTNRMEVSEKVYEVKSEFGEHRIYGPVITEDFGGLLHNDRLSVQLVKTESGNYYLRVYNWHSGKSWKFVESITTLEKETIALTDLSRDTGACMSSGCTHEEIGYALLPRSKYLSGETDLKIRVNAKRWGTQVITVPKQYIQAFMEKAG